MQFFRSIFFVIQMYLAMLIMGFLGVPLLLLGKKIVRKYCKLYCAWIIWSARWIVGIHCEIRGNIEQKDVVVAAKHQSFLDVILLFYALPNARFIMKYELLFAPIFGLYARALGSIAIKRSKGSSALRKMLLAIRSAPKPLGQLVIYPQGTRTKPGQSAAYHIGVAAIYEECGTQCIPVATNAGHFWPRKGILRKPGTAVIEFLEPISKDEPRKRFMELVETRIETASQALSNL